MPEELAYTVGRALYRFSLLDVVDIADIAEREDDEVGQLYFALMQRLRVDEMLAAVAELPRGDRWSEMARLALRDDLYGALRGLTIEVLNFTDPAEPATQKIGDWASHNARRLERVGALLGELGLGHGLLLGGEAPVEVLGGGDPAGDDDQEDDAEVGCGGGQ